MADKECICLDGAHCGHRIKRHDSQMYSGEEEATVDWTDQRRPAMNPWTEETSAQRI